MSVINTCIDNSNSDSARSTRDIPCLKCIDICSFYSHFSFWLVWSINIYIFESFNFYRLKPFDAAGLQQLRAVWYRTGDLVRRDEHGVIHYLGRLDSQIQLHGHRVELGEVEGALRAVSVPRNFWPFAR